MNADRTSLFSTLMVNFHLPFSYNNKIGKLWNCLPPKITAIDPVSEFRTQFRAHYVCMYVYFYLNSQVHTGYKPNYMEANAIMRPIKKRKGGGRRRTVAKQQGGQFRSKINNWLVSWYILFYFARMNRHCCLLAWTSGLSKLSQKDEERKEILHESVKHAIL